MKKILILLVLVVALLAGCSGGGNGDGDIVEISERFFITEMMHINRNAEEYVGRTVRYEGMFRTLHWAATGEDYYMVLRHVMDCCGDDGIIGYEIYLGDIAPLPDDAWVEVTGVLEFYEVGGGMQFLRVVATSIREMDVRGAEFVQP